MKVYFSHGKESGPWGNKIKKLAAIASEHGWSDYIIPPENSIRYAQEADCTLHLISGDHPLNSSIEVVEGLFEGFLRKALSETG